MKKEMLINCLQTEEIRIAILEDGVLEELYVERASHESYVGNIYKGRVVNIEPSIQAAFVDFGVGRNGFLHVSDVEPAYYRELEREQRGRRGDRGGRGRRDRYYDDYDAPRRREERQAPPERRGEDQGPETPVDPSPSPSYSEPAYDMPHEQGPEIIVEQLMEEDDFIPGMPAETSPEAEVEPDADWPAEEKSLDDPQPPTEPTTTSSQEALDAPEEPEPAAEAAPEEDRPRRRGSRGGRGRSSRGRGPRRRSDKGATPEPGTEPTGEAPSAEPPPADEPRPRPMDSLEHRTGPDDPALGPIEPRPASGDLTDDDLSFSKAPPPRAESRPSSPIPSTHAEQPIEEIIVEQEEFIEPDDLGSEPLEPAIPKIEPDDSVEELAAEEKAMEEEDDFAQSEVSAEQAPQEGVGDDRGDEFAEVDEYMPRGRGNDRGDRRDRGGRGRGDRRGGRDRDRRGPRGGRDRGRTGGGGSGGGRPGFGPPRPHIEDIFKRGQEVLVQVIKEGIGTKGPTLSTYISIAGRYLVLMPGLNRIGVSRKIEDEETRRRLREIMNELRPPKGIGFIIRTAGQDRNREELQSDLAYLSRLWQVVARRIKKQKSPCEIYKESDMVTRTIRDIFTSDIDTIWVDERGAYEAAKEFMEAVMPRYAERIKFYDGAAPMFHEYGIEQEIARIQERKISLPYGGSIVIDQTEAMVAIDVNSGNFRADNNNAEETAYQMNLQAAKEIARQLRLRDLGGVIANDFIDMREERHRRGVEKALRDAVRRDRARTKILRISQFGIIEMTRQRIRPSLKRSAFHECGHCKGTGHVKTGESVSIEVMRMLQLAVNRPHITRIDIRVHDDVAQYLLNKKRKEIAGLEERGNKQVVITSAGAAVSPEFLEFSCLDSNGNEVKFLPSDEPPPPPRRRR